MGSRSSPPSPTGVALWRLDPLDWCEVDRALGIALVALAFRVVNAAQASASGVLGPDTFLDSAVLSALVPTLWGLAGWWSVLSLVGVWARRAAPRSRVYVGLVLGSFWLTNAAVSVAIGTFHSPFWIVLPGATVITMVLFGWRRALAYLAPGLALIAAASAGVATGALRYAPVFSRPPYDAAGRPEPAWVASIGGSSLVATGVTLLAAQLLMHRLRQREAQLQLLARSDVLTGVGNRRALFERLEHEVARRARRGGDLSLVVVDVDHFKSINDRHGHPAGDGALCAVAASLSASTRQTDFVGRIGGEEFALLLPDTDAPGAAKVAERARAAIEALVHRTAEGETVPLTATFGVATLPDGVTRSADEVFRAADAALYAGKRSGRNRVSLAGA